MSELREGTLGESGRRGPIAWFVANPVAANLLWRSS